MVWKEVLLPGMNNTLTVLTDGTEGDEYFTSIMVFDANELNCLSPQHPLKDQVENYFVEKMKDFKPKTEIFALLKV